MNRSLTLLASSLYMALVASVSISSAQEIPRVATATSGQREVVAPEFTFYLFWKEDNQATRAMNSKLAELVEQKARRTQIATIRLNDPANQAIVDRFKVSRAPMPLVLCVADNGAITGAITDKVTDEAVDRLLVTPSMVKCMKALQEKKLVLVHVKFDDRDEIPNGIHEFAADPEFKARTILVSFRHGDPSEVSFLKDMEIGAETNKSLVALLAPPGVLVGKYTTGVTKAKIAAELHEAGQCCTDPNCKHNK